MKRVALLLVLAACRRDDAPRCNDAPARWTPVERERVTTALSGVPWTRVTLANLDAYAVTVSATAKRVCGTELKQRCVARAKDRFEALVDQLAPPLDPNGREAVPLAVSALPPLAECETLTDEAELALPPAAGDRARVEMFEHDQARAWAAFAVGRTSAAQTIVDADALGLSKLNLPRLSAERLTLASALALRAGKPDESQARFEEALAAATASGSPGVLRRVWRARLHAKLGSGDMATFERDVERARQAFTAPELDVFEGIALLRANKGAEAETVFARAAPTRVEDIAALKLGLAHLALARGDADTARQRLTEARDALLPLVGDEHPFLAPIELAFGAAESMRGNLRSALTHDNRAVLMAPTAETLLARAATYLEAGDIANARRDATRARELGATRDANRLLGDILTANGNADEAKAYYDLAGLPPSPPPRLPSAPADLAARAKALPNEPSRTALALWIALAKATQDPQAARAAISLYQAMPQLGRGATYDSMWALSRRAD